MVTIDGGDTFKCLEKNRDNGDYLSLGRWKEMSNDLVKSFMIIFHVLNVKTKNYESDDLANLSIFKDCIFTKRSEDSS